jgi:hypothetical protein
VTYLVTNNTMTTHREDSFLLYSMQLLIDRLDRRLMAAFHS